MSKYEWLGENGRIWNLINFNSTTRMVESHLLKPFGWKKPRVIFVDPMGDLFHESVPDEWIDRVFAVMALAPQHTFIVLTKRAKRMREYVSALYVDKARILNAAPWGMETPTAFSEWVPGVIPPSDDPDVISWPLPNVILGVSVENQEQADERVPELLATPAAKRFVSQEPALGMVDWTRIRNSSFPWHPPGPPAAYILDALAGKEWSTQRGEKVGECNVNRIDCIISGGESGPGAAIDLILSELTTTDKHEQMAIQGGE